MPQNQSNTQFLVLGSGLLIVFLALALFKRSGEHHPYLEVDIPGGLRITYLNETSAGAAQCERTLDNIASVMKSACPVCRITARTCLTRLDAEQTRWLSEAPLSIHSARLPNGVALYWSKDPELARESCMESQRQSAGQANTIVCYPPHTPRPLPPAVDQLDANAVGIALLGLLAAIAATWLIGYLIIRHDELHAHFSHDPIDAGPQKFHALPTPRIGGVALYAGLLAAAGVLMLPVFETNQPEYGLLLLAGAPAFLGGLIEDITKMMGIYQRLLLTMVSAALCAWLLGAILPRLDLPLMDHLLLWTLPALLFTVFAVSGVANAINIIDGYNGLAAGYAVLVLAAMAWVSTQVGDVFLFTTCLALIGALLGFLVWNWPAGKLFLGDGGAYLLGFLLAELSVLMVVRNPQVTPWFPLALLIYPVFETLFSIYRRQLLRGHGAMRPDALHLHQLIYARVVRHGVGSKDPSDRLLRNNRVAPYLWTLNAVGAAWASVFWQSRPAIVAGIVGFCLFYMLAYRLIIKWRVPRWVG